MLTFKEALKVVKKSDKLKSDGDYGSIGRYKIINCKHTSDVRDGVDRNANLDRKRVKELKRLFLML